VYYELGVVVTEALGQFGNPEVGECPPLQTVTRGLVKRQKIEKTRYVLQRTRECVNLQ
jgi:hypothetical protein